MAQDVDDVEELSGAIEVVENVGRKQLGSQMVPENLRLDTPHAGCQINLKPAIMTVS